MALSLSKIVQGQLVATGIFFLLFEQGFSTKFQYEFYSQQKKWKSVFL